MSTGISPDEAMRLALQSARRGLGRTFPNPTVGAVVFRGSRILGRGRTSGPGGAHAEVVAIRSALRRHGERTVRGAALAVTLEPCCFTGRTGPCTEAILAAGIRRVFIGCRDPHPRVLGRGARWLRAQGLVVENGVLGAECREHHRGFFMVQQHGRPFVTLKLASTLDGRIATSTGESRWITGPAAREWVHRLRERSDGVMVGSGTALADDPELTARRGRRVVRRPVRVLVDSRLRVPPDARLYRPRPAESSWVLTRKGARGRAAVAATGARLIDVPGRGGQLDLAKGMQALGQAGLTTLLVEGGGELAAALLRAALVDEIHWLLAPKLIGGDGRPALGPLGVAALSGSVELKFERTRRIGDDWHVCARVERHGRRGKR